MIKDDASNLALVIQGPFNQELINNINKNIHNYPRLEIIIVVWEADRKNYDVMENRFGPLVKFKYIQDPGGQESAKGEKLNVNRQLVSTHSGLEECSRDYVLKLRSDVSISIRKTIEVFNKFNRITPNHKIKESILVLNLTTINPRRFKRLFAVNDWIYGGLREDICNLINHELFPDEYLDSKQSNFTSLKYNAEQWMVLPGILGENFQKLFPHSYYYDLEMEERYYQILKKFIIVHPLLLGLKSSKYKFFQFGLWYGFTLKEWKSIYQKNFNYHFDLERVLYNILRFIFKIKKIIS